jgi:hypothetical protein
MRTLSAFALVAVACSSAPMPEPTDGRDDAFLAGGKADGPVASAEETAAVLALVNTASLAELDEGVPLDVRAAEHIVAHRDGPDAALGTADDDPFDDLAELDAVPWVGPAAFAALVEYVGTVPVADGDACLLISEYAEGIGNNNKAIEIFNCGTEAVELANYSLCLVRNDDTTCSLERNFSAVELAPGEVWVTCRTLGGNWNDPLASLTQRCDEELVGVLTMSGDDRFAIRDAEGAILDAFGQLAVRPSWDVWANVVMRRCNLEPRDGSEYMANAEWFTNGVSGNDHAQLGLPPVAGCAE